MYYARGYDPLIKTMMFLNYYYNYNNTNAYARWNVAEPKTVYYTGTFGENTTLFTNPELTQFVLSQQYGYPNWAGVFVDATLTDYNISPDISIYSFDSQTGVILNNVGTIANLSYWYENARRTSNLSEFCDNYDAWNSESAYYPAGQNGPTVGGYAYSNFDTSTGQPQSSYLYPRFKQSDNATTVYSVNYNGLITAANPCTYIPTWNASWGATAQEAIDGTNPISIKPTSGDSMITNRYIIKADESPFYDLPNPFYIAYDGYVRVFNNQYWEAGWNDSYPLEIITPPASPYSIVLIPTSCCSCFSDPNYDSQKFTAYSNFPTMGPGTAIYADAALTTPLQFYQYYTNGVVYFTTNEPKPYPSNVNNC